MRNTRHLSKCLTREVPAGTEESVEIDYGITNLIMLLNQHGHETLFSCEGHGETSKLYFVMKYSPKTIELVYKVITKIKTRQAHGLVGGFLFSNVGDPIKGSGHRWDGITFYTVIKNTNKYNFERYNKHIYKIFDICLNKT